jgi:hypothetical protein
MQCSSPQHDVYSDLSVVSLEETLTVFNPTALSSFLPVLLPKTIQLDEPQQNGGVPGAGSNVPRRHIQTAVVELGKREYHAHAHRRVTI